MRRKSKLSLRGGHCLGVLGNQHIVRAQLSRVLSFFRRGGDHRHMRAHGVSELHAHVAEAAKTDDANFLALPDFPVLERRIGGDAGAEQRRGRRRVEVCRHAQDKALIDR